MASAAGQLVFAAVVPAAGRGERFGGDKLIARIAGQPLLDHTLRSLLDAGAAEVVVVVAGSTTLTGVSRLADPRVRVVVNPAPDRGMFSSIQAGLAELGHAAQVLVLPGDMPYVQIETVVRIAAAAARLGLPVTPTCHGQRGHPVSLPASAVAPLLSADPSKSLKDALIAAGLDRTSLDVDDPGILRDVDSRSDLPDVLF